MDKLTKCQEIFEHNIKYLQRISIAKTNASRTASIIVIIVFEKGELEINKTFWGNDLNKMKDEINKFIETEIKL